MSARSPRTRQLYVIILRMGVSPEQYWAEESRWLPNQGLAVRSRTDDGSLPFQYLRLATAGKNLMQGDYAQQYGELQQWHWWFRGRRRVIESILRHEVDSVSPLDILSVGCGPAEGLGWLVPFAGPGGKVVGLDRDPLHARRLADGTEFILGTLNDAPLVDASFDVVLALDVLEHLDDDVSGLQEAARIVKPGGLLLITVPALPSLWGGQDVVSEHRRRYTRGSLSQLFTRAKLTNYRLQYFNTLLFPMAAVVRWQRRALGLANRPRSDADDNHPGLVNDALAWIFGMENHFINYVSAPIGVSLVARYRPPN